jgi:molecular chaperone GrpE (heat shock protein)
LAAGSRGTLPAASAAQVDSVDLATDWPASLPDDAKFVDAEDEVAVEECDAIAAPSELLNMGHPVTLEQTLDPPAVTSELAPGLLLNTPPNLVIETTPEQKSDLDEPAAPEAAAVHSDGLAILSSLLKQREEIIDLLFAQRGVTQSDIVEAVSGYADVWRRALVLKVPVDAELDQWAKRLLNRSEQNVSADRGELESAVQQADRYLHAHSKLSLALDTLLHGTSELVAELSITDPDFETADVTLQTSLLNHKKGLEIVQRMIGRTIERRKDLASGRLPARFETLETIGQPADPDHFEEFINRVRESMKAHRQGRDRVIVAARDYAENCRKGLITLAKSLLPAIDGVDSGLANEPVTRGQLTAAAEGSAERLGLIDRWYCSYQKCRTQFDEFGAQAGLETQIVEPGMAFDPETMEPVGTVVCPESADDSVASVVRRGFSLAGENLRPVGVEVVRNS